MKQCPACTSQNNEYWAKARDREYCTTNDEEFTFYRCRDCHSLFLNPVPKERLAVIYPENYYSFAEQKTSIVQNIKTALDKRFFRSFSALLPGSNLSALDVGGGVGWELNVLRQADMRIQYTEIVDLDPKAKHGAEQNGHHYFCGKIEDFSSQKKFDIILLLNLIEHVEFPGQILKKCADLLTPNGVVIIKTPNCDSWDARIFRHKHWGGYHCPRHWTLFTKDSFIQLANNSGLSVQQCSYTQGAPFWATSILFAMQRLGIVDISSQRPVVYHPLYAPLTALFAGFDFLRGIFFKTSQMFFVLKKKHLQ